MNEWNWLPLLWVFLVVLIVILSKKKNSFTFFWQVFWPLGILFVLNTVISLLHLPFIARIGLPEKLPFILWLFVLLALLVFVVRVLGFFFFDFLVWKKQGIKYPRLFKDIVVFALYVIGVFLILSYYLQIKKISIFVASSAVVTVIIGLAVQDILGNLFSGIVLNFDDSFKLGNWIRAGEFEGRIEQLGWRSIKVRTVDDTLVVIPNQAASKQDVVVFSTLERKPFRMRMHIGASYRTPPDQVIHAVLRVLQSIDEVLKEPAPLCFVHDFADSAITYDIRYWMLDFPALNMINSEIRRRIWYEFSRAGIQIPFPQRDLHFKREPPPILIPDEMETALRGNGLLKLIEEEDFKNLLKGVDHGIYGQGETIIREGEESGFFYHMLSGEVDVRKGMRSLAVLGPGDFFGEISLVTGDKSNATVVALKESVIIRISPARFKEAVKMNESMAQKLSDVIAQRQAETKTAAEQMQGADVDTTIRKNSASLFLRIIAYFRIKS